ncbi:MAG: xanthine dehydrogenase family protein subunit M [Desulfovibrionales bacterium]|nr:xanthine dehydrogenase family protein subunit M [Desulfovibrionales bacterium]
MSAVHTATSLNQALEMLAQYPEAQLMAGGTDLLVRRRSSMSGSDILFLGRVPELQDITEQSEFLAIGAAASLRCIIADPLVKQYAPLLVQALGTIGGPAIRNMATLGGNICTASPAGDSLPPLYLLDARIELVSRTGTRSVPIASFIHGPGQTARHNHELVSRILLPKVRPLAQEQFVKIGCRQALAIAVASFAGQAELDERGHLAHIRMAWGSVGPTVMRLPALENELTGASITPKHINYIRAALRTGLAPISDGRASATYRYQVAANVTARFVEGLRETSQS